MLYGNRELLEKCCANSMKACGKKWRDQATLSLGQEDMEYLFDKNDAEKIKSLFPVNKSQLQWVEDGNSCKPEFAQELVQELVQEFEPEVEPEWKLTTDF